MLDVPSSFTSSRRARVAAVLIAACAIATAAAAQEQRFADLGDFRLESGEVIRDCRIGYRTVGALDAARSNAVVFPTWATGTSEQIVSGDVGPGKLVDSTRFFVIVVDAFANGVSSSPSNSRLQPRMAFPRITIRDMVEAQHALLTQVLKLERVRAVVGISMGGMQAFQWMVSYPTYMDVAIPVVGSPRLASYDLLHWRAEIDAIMNHPEWKGGDYAENPALTSRAEFGLMLLTSPEHVNREVSREQVLQAIERDARASHVDASDSIRQSQAMMALDVSQAFGGSMERAAAAVRARLLVVVAALDHVVTPQPALDFARLVPGARVLVLQSDCGHLAPGCEEESAMREAVADALGSSRVSRGER